MVILSSLSFCFFIIFCVIFVLFSFLFLFSFLIFTVSSALIGVLRALRICFPPFFLFEPFLGNFVPFLSHTHFHTFSPSSVLMIEILLFSFCSRTSPTKKKL